MSIKPGTEVPQNIRRTILGSLIALPVVGILSAWAGSVRRNAKVMRPTAVGTSSQNCAMCGSHDHAMLTCPSNPKVI